MMRTLIATSVCILVLAGCREAGHDPSSAPAPAPVTSATSPAPNADAAAAQTTQQTSTESSVPSDSASTSATDENHEQGTWSGQIAFAQPVSMFNYVGAESGDFAPMRFRNDSEVGKKILAACADGQMCEFTGAVEWLDEAPPTDASAIGQIVKVDTVVASTTP